MSPCHPPRASRYYLLIGVALLGIGIYRNMNLLMLLGYVLLLMAGANYWAAGRSVRGLRATRRLGEWLFARSPCAVEVQLSNPSRRARLGVKIVDSGPEGTATWSVNRLPGGGSLSWRHEVVPSRRGRMIWRELRAGSGYPFGLLERHELLASGEEVIVLPSLGWLHRGRFLRHLRGLSMQPQYSRVRRRLLPQPAAQAEFHGLRAFHSGDSPRLIHWRTSARCGQLMVREFEDELNDNLLLVVDPTLPSESDYCGVPLREQFEEAISLAATICWEWCRRRGDRLVLATAGPTPVVHEGLTGSSHARRVLECLAVLKCRTGPTNPALFTLLQDCTLPSSSLVVLISLGASNLADALRQTLGCRVNCLDATRTEGFDFYTPPKDTHYVA